MESDFALANQIGSLATGSYGEQRYAEMVGAHFMSTFLFLMHRRKSNDEDIFGAGHRLCFIVNSRSQQKKIL